MKKEQFKKLYKVQLIPRSESRFRRFLEFFYRPLKEFWFTYKLPFCEPVITHPDKVKYPMVHKPTLAHELVHVGQLRPWYGPFVVALLYTVFPLPILFSGRFLVERPAYLLNIVRHGYPVEAVVNVLWYDYGWCWPKPLMRQWFKKKLKENQK